MLFCIHLGVTRVCEMTMAVHTESDSDSNMQDGRDQEQNHLRWSCSNCEIRSTQTSRHG